MSFSKKTIETLRNELRYAQDNQLIEYYIDFTRMSIVPSVGAPTKHNLILERPYFSIRLLPNTSDAKKRRLISCIQASYENINTVSLAPSGAAIEVHYESD